MVHYPPISEKSMKSSFIDVLKEYNVEKVVYGHLHGEALVKAVTGSIDGIEYILTSADYIDFDPVIIL
jgi:hypothetical protein